MNIPPKYEDVVAKLDAAEVIIQAGEHVESHLEKQIDILRIDLDAALGREAALREDLEALRESYEAMRDRKNSIVYLQQRLTFAEQRVQRMVDCSKGQDSIATGYLSDILALLKPAAEPHKCIECGSQYCHGVCVERGDDDHKFYDSAEEGEGS